jgi:hypothetical protein
MTLGSTFMPILPLTCKYCRRDTSVPVVSLAKAFLFRCASRSALTSFTQEQCKALLTDADRRR